MPGRESLEIPIQGMYGIPEEFLVRRKERDAEREKQKAAS
eukprot:COSAG05_NODE_16936_length_335_cov_0.872881_1_plen_39_part_10